MRVHGARTRARPSIAYANSWDCFVGRPVRRPIKGEGEGHVQLLQWARSQEPPAP